MDEDPVGVEPPGRLKCVDIIFWLLTGQHFAFWS